MPGFGKGPKRTLASGRVYLRTPFASAVARPGTLPATMPCTAVAGGGMAASPPQVNDAPANPRPRRDREGGGEAPGV